MSRKYTIKNTQVLKGYFGRAPIYIFESEIREAMKNTKSNKQAAKYIGVSYPTYKKYAEQYIDNETHKSLFEMHRSTGKGIRRYYKRDYVAKVNKIINGEIPCPKRYKNRMKFIRDLIKTMVFEEKCAICGWNDKRPFDLTTPLLLDFIDGNEQNYLKNNIRLLCPNCYSIYVGDVYHSKGYRKQYQGLHPKEPIKEVPKIEIDYNNFNIDKPLSEEEIANLDLSKL